MPYASSKSAVDPVNAAQLLPVTKPTAAIRFGAGFGLMGSVPSFLRSRTNVVITALSIKRRTADETSSNAASDGSRNVVVSPLDSRNSQPISLGSLRSLSCNDT